MHLNSATRSLRPKSPVRTSLRSPARTLLRSPVGTLLRRRLLLNDVRLPRLTFVAVYRLLLDRSPYLALAMHRLLLNALRLLHLCCPGLLTAAGLHVLPAHLSLHAYSSQELGGLRYAPPCSGPCAVVTSPGTSAHFALLLCGLFLSLYGWELLFLPAVGHCSFPSFLTGSEVPIPGCFLFISSFQHSGSAE